MKQIWTLILCIITLSAGFAQGDASDPEAARILKEIADEFNSYKTLKVDFRLTLDLPGQDEEIQNGNFVQKGDKYVLELDDQAIYNDAANVWVYIKKNNEAQLNNVEEDAEVDLLSPKDMFKTFYEGKDFYYAIVGHTGNLTEIEFKPLDRDSEYSKMRVQINEKANRMKTLKIFAKDGSRYTMQVDAVTPNYKVSEEFFTFNPSNYPGIHIEDLRID